MCSLSGYLVCACFFTIHTSREVWSRRTALLLLHKEQLRTVPPDPPDRPSSRQRGHNNKLLSLFHLLPGRVSDIPQAGWPSFPSLSQPVTHTTLFIAGRSSA
jgi:hypothetical protein